MMPLRGLLLIALPLLVTISTTTIVLKYPSPDASKFTSLIELTHNEGSNLNPTFSPDGKLVAFSSNRSGNFDIWLMNTLGRKPVRLTTTPGDKSNPKWSPDGKEIAFLSVENKRTSIWVMDLASLKPRLLAEAAELQNDFEWSPNSLTLAYESRAAGNWIISTVDIFGHKTQLTAPDSSSKYPSWSPDGRQIAFSSNRFSKNFDIWIMNTDGNGPKQLTAASGFSIKPRINPLDGRVLFLSNRTSGWDLWVMNADGANQSQVLKPSIDESKSS
jgi:Tol biopolymer transport system component